MKFLKNFPSYSFIKEILHREKNFLAMKYKINKNCVTVMVQWQILPKNI